MRWVVAVALATAPLLLVTPESHAAKRVYKLPGGGKLAVPKSSLSRGAKVVVRRHGRPRVRRRGHLRSVGRAVSLRVRRGRVTGPVRLTLPYRKRIRPLGMPLDLTVQIGYFDAHARQWRTIPARVNRRTRKVRARISPAIWNEANLVIDGKGAHAAARSGSSWWNPLSWDWGSLAMRLSQRVGELRGARTGPAPCTSGVPVPGWAEQVITNNGAELQLRTCAEGSGDRVVVQIVNNRPYGVILKYGAPVAWGWHEMPGDVAGAIATAFADELVSPNELYIAPLKRASVGVPPGGWYFAQFQAEVTHKSLAADVLRFVASELDLSGVRPQVLGKLAGKCSWLLKPKLDGTVSITTDVLDAVSGVADCMLAAAPTLAAERLMDHKKIDELQHSLALIARIGRSAEAIKLAGALADLYHGMSPAMQGNMMFSIRRGADDLEDAGSAPDDAGSEPPPPAPPPPTPPPPPPAPLVWPEQQGSHGANTFTNPYNASGMGPKIAPYQWVQVSCKVLAPQIRSANPDGYWYRIASSPWNNRYYAVANTFWNGDVPGRLPYTHNTDWAVPDC